VGHCDLEAARAALREAKDALEQIQTVGEDAASDTVRANVLLAHAAMRRVCSVLAPIV
jgi:hypothetical protein